LAVLAVLLFLDQFYTKWISD